MRQRGHLSYEGSGWGLILEVPSKTAFAAATFTTLKLILLLMTLILTLSGLLLWVITRLVTQPISDLARTIRAIDEGDLSQKATVLSGDEIGQLASSFNAMTVKLNESHKDLEAKIAQRTEALSQSEKTTRLVIETANDAFIGMDEQGRVIDWNQKAETVFGWPREAILGQVLADAIIPFKRRHDHSEGLKRFLATGNGPVLNKSIEIMALHRDGHEFPVDLTVWPVRVGDGYLFNAFVRDITARKKMEAQLFQSQKMETVGTLAGGIAHDLNNQLTPLSGYVDLLLTKTLPDDPNYHLLDEANSAAKRCADVVQRLLNFSRPAAQKKEAVDIAALMLELKNLLPKLIPSTIQAEFIGQVGLWPVVGNETELQSVLMNLAVNARDAMPRGGQLTVEVKNLTLTNHDRAVPASSIGNYVHISVRDTGVGMSADIVSKIFEPFFTTKEKGKGTGLGLAMAFNIIKNHGGWISVSSRPGKGTIFQIYLPAAIELQPASAGKVKAAEAPLLPKGNETVLLVDDEKPIRDMGKAFLSRLGYTALLAEDGEQAIRLYRRHQNGVGAVILDMTMPKLTGKQTLKQILEINPKAKVILVSGYTAEGTSEELLAEGAMGFLQKPYNIMLFAQTLRRVLDGAALK